MRAVYPPQGNYGQPYGQPPGVPVTIKTSAPPLAFLVKAMLTPTAEVAGQTHTLTWGDSTIMVPPGVHNLAVFVNYLGRNGVGNLQIDTRSGQPVTVYWAMPHVIWVSANLDYQPVKSNGMGWLIALIGLPVAIILLCCCGSFGLNALDGN